MNIFRKIYEHFKKYKTIDGIQLAYHTKDGWHRSFNDDGTSVLYRVVDSINGLAVKYEADFANPRVFAKFKNSIDKASRFENMITKIKRN